MCQRPSSEAVNASTRSKSIPKKRSCLSCLARRSERHTVRDAGTDSGIIYEWRQAARVHEAHKSADREKTQSNKDRCPVLAGRLDARSMRLDSCLLDMV